MYVESVATLGNENNEYNNGHGSPGVGVGVGVGVSVGVGVGEVSHSLPSLQRPVGDVTL